MRMANGSSPKQKQLKVHHCTCIGDDIEIWN